MRLEYVLNKYKLWLVLWLLMLVFNLDPEGWLGLQSWETIYTEVAMEAIGSRDSRRGSRKKEKALSRILWEEHYGNELEPGGLGSNPDCHLQAVSPGAGNAISPCPKMRKILVPTSLAHCED